MPLSLYVPPVNSFYVLGPAVMALGGLATGLSPMAWIVVALGLPLLIVGLVRDFDGCEGIEKDFQEARDRMDSFCGLLGLLQSGHGFPARREDWDGWEDSDDEAVCAFAEFVAHTSEQRREFKSDYRALQRFFGKCERTRRRRPRWFEGWFAGREEWMYPVVRMVTMLDAAYSNKNPRATRKETYHLAFYAWLRHELGHDE